MRCVIPQIVWNSQQQILSTDFDPTSNGQNGSYRLVTAGADQLLLIWELKKADSLKPDIVCKQELNRHEKAVNVVRYSPDGKYIASGDDDAIIIIWKNVKTPEGEDKWMFDKFLRKHLGDVTDLSWSSDSNYLISGSVDNTAVFWDVKKGSAKYFWPEHSGFVQGASLDPLGQIGASICNDRTLRLFDIDTGKMKHKISKYNSNWFTKKSPTPTDDDQKEQKDVIPLDNDTTANGNGTTEPTKKSTSNSTGHHMFQDDSLATFCRRLCFSPHGEFLIVPGGCIPNEKNLSVNSKKNQIAEEEGSPLEENNKKKVKMTKTAPDDHAVLLFCRNDWSIPCAVFPTGKSYSIATRFCPVYFNRQNDDSFSYDKDFLNPVTKDDRRNYCAGKLRKNNNNNGGSNNVEESEKLLLDTPYRAVYAVATNNTVMIGATDRQEPLAVARNIHFARLTDLSWSPDGLVLVTTSTDGYCSIITFDKNELGVPFNKDEIPNVPEPTRLPIPVKEVKVKEPKVKTPKVKETKVKTPKVKETKPKQQPKKKKEKTILDLFNNKTL